jgi:tRNA threonylcarbamoyladenosine biosynthesis protein TsaE
LKLTLPDLAATERLGAALGASLGQGDVVLLAGGLGAGKTALARAAINARMPVAQEVPSPTFTLVQNYEADDILIAHCDLYRIKSVNELEELGLDEAMEAGALLVEWPERAPGFWPEERLEIALTIVNGARREAMLTAHGSRWAGRLRQIEKAISA